MEERFARLRNRLENNKEGRVDNDAAHNERGKAGSPFKLVDPKEYAKSFFSSEETEAKTKDHSPHEKRHVKKVDAKKQDLLDSVLSEIKGGAQAVGRGVAPIVDFVSTPTRKLTEAVVGHKVPTLYEKISEGYEAPDWKENPTKAAIHEGLEWAGATVPGAGIGSALMKGAQYIPKAGKYIGKAGEWLGGKAFDKAMHGQVAPLAEMTAAAVPMGAAAKTIKEESGVEPILGDIAGSLLGGKAYTVARHPSTVTDFLARVGSGDLGKTVRQSYLSNLEEAIGKENIDPLIEKIKGYKPVMEGHNPTVAEMTMPSSHTEKMYPQLAILERTGLMSPGVAGSKGETDTLINKILQGLEKEGGSSIGDVRRGLGKAYQGDRQSVEDILEELMPKKGGDVLAQDVGSTIRGETKEHLTKGWEKRKAESDPFWKNLEKDERHLSPDKTREHIDEKMKIGIADPGALSEYKKVKNAIGEGAYEATPEELERKLNQFIGKSNLEKMSDEDWINYLYKSGLKKDAETLRISQLDAERQRVLSLENAARNANNDAQAHHLKELREKIQEDLFEVSEDARRAVAAYREYSPPINKIENVPSNAMIVRKNYGEPQTLETSIGESFTQGSKAPEKVQKLFEAFDTRGEAGIPHKEAVTESLTSHAQNELMDKVVNKDGLVDLGALKRYESKITGVHEANPEFKQQLKSLAAAQANLENQFGRVKGGGKDLLLEGEPQQVVSQILKADNKQNALNEVLKRLEKVGEVDRREGMISGVLEHMQETLRGSSNKRVITPHAYKTYMKKHGPILKELLDSDQYRMLEGINKIMSQKHFAATATATPGSPTQTLLDVKGKFTGEGRGLVRKLLHAGSSSVRTLDNIFSIFSENIGKDVKTIKTEMLDKFLTSSEEALKDLHGTKHVSDKEIFDYAKSIIPRNVLLYLMKDES